MVTLIIQSTPVSFGAVGTPMLVGVQTGLSNSDTVAAAIAPATLPEYIPVVAERVAFLHMTIGFIIPLLMVAMMTRFFGARRSFREGFRRLRQFALFGGLAFTLPYYLVGRVSGAGISVAGRRRDRASDRHHRRAARASSCRKPSSTFPTGATGEASWKGKMDSEIAHEAADTAHPHGRGDISLMAAWSPYLITIAILVLTRVIGPLKAWLTGPSTTIAFENLFGSGITSKVQMLYSPGTVLILASVISYFIYRMKASDYSRAWGLSAKTMIAAAPALLLAVPMVQVFINSGSEGVQSMPLTLAAGIGAGGHRMADVRGADRGDGAFIAGSNTISNMMFSLFQFSTAQGIGLDLAGATIVVALQAIGGAAGNMICVHNVVAASATVGLVDREGDLILQDPDADDLLCRAGRLHRHGADLWRLLVAAGAGLAGRGAGGDVQPRRHQPRPRESVSRAGRSRRPAFFRRPAGQGTPPARPPAGPPKASGRRHRRSGRS